MSVAHTFRVLALAVLLLAGCETRGPALSVGGSRSPREPPAPPADLVARLDALARGFDGRVGMAVEDVQAGWLASYDGQRLYPQQSVSKLCTAIAVLDLVDRGRMRLSDPVLVRKEDMSVFNQPIQAHLTADGYPTTIGDLLVGAIAQSDNAADDILIREVGGPQVVQRALASRKAQGIRCGPQEHVLESKVAGLDWRPEYSFGRTFWDARDKVDPAVRTAKLQAYLDDPDDGATPVALVRLLARLKRGELLSAASTARLLDIMTATRTGPLRLPGGLGPGWTIAHKTGTGQDLGDLSTGNNDVSLLTAPDGRTYAVAVMIASTRQPVPERQRLMADTARAVVRLHDGVDSAPP